METEILIHTMINTTTSMIKVMHISVMPVEVMDVHCVEDMAIYIEMLSSESMVTALRQEWTWVTTMST